MIESTASIRASVRTASQREPRCGMVGAVLTIAVVLSGRAASPGGAAVL